MDLPRLVTVREEDPDAWLVNGDAGGSFAMLRNTTTGSLTAGRYRVLKEFAKRDVDVTSEALRYPMIGHISNFWYGQFSNACPFGGNIIPLLPLIYRKSAVWGYSGGSKADHAFDHINQFFTERVRIAFSVEIWTARRSQTRGISISCGGSICTR